jgi:hemerythrin superfamily protein
MTDATIFDDLKADHDRQRVLMAAVNESRGDSADRQESFDTLRLELQAHAAAEEEALYATMLAKPDLREDARHSVSEHKEVDDLLGKLMELKFGGEAWNKTYDEMVHRYTHHIDEEEEEMFPDAAKAFSAAEEARLARLFESRKPKELERAEAHPPGDERE